MNPAPDTSGGRGGQWLGYLLAAACLLWVFHDIRWRDLFANVRAMNWWLLIPAIAADIGSYLSQGARWSLLLRPLGRLSVLKATQAVYAGLFVNEVLPLRTGEILRGYLAMRWTSLPVAAIFSSMLIERFLDGVWIVLAIGGVMLTVPLPRYLVDAEEFLALAVFALAALLAFVLMRKRRAAPGAPRPAHGLRARLSHLVEHTGSALRLIGGARSIYPAAALSALLLALQAVSFWLVMEAYHLNLSLWHGTVVFLIVHFGTMVPGAPSNVGIYQFFTVVGLSLFHVDKTLATGFSVVVFLILTMPLWAIGLVAFARAGLSLRTIRAELATLARPWQTPP